MAKNDTAASVSAPPSMLDELRNAPVEESYPEAFPWRAEIAGEGIEGEVIAIGQYHDDTYSDKVLRTLIVKDDNDFVWSVIPFHRKLRSEMAKNVASVGDRVAFLYLGEEQSETDPSKFMRDYRMGLRKNRSMRKRVINPAVSANPDPFDAL